jgi:2-(1,2-epoxy-1,2-dihydrophenyl)acetyl-CoA isomerase
MTLRIDRPAPSVLRLLIDRPAARNAIDSETRNALLAAIEAARDDGDVRALVLGGTGGMFCAGGDLPSMVGITHGAALERMAHGHRVVAALWTFPKPVVVAVEKFAVGAGAGLALLADEIVMGRGAMFGFPFARLGLVPDWGLMGSAPRRIGPTAAARLFRDGASVKAEAAVALGLADRLVDDGEVQAEALRVAEDFATLAPRAFAALKLHLRGDADVLGLAAEAAAQADCLTSPEFAEGYAAFRAKRAPVF